MISFHTHYRVYIIIQQIIAQRVEVKFVTLKNPEIVKIYKFLL